MASSHSFREDLDLALQDFAGRTDAHPAMASAGCQVASPSVVETVEHVQQRRDRPVQRPVARLTGNQKVEADIACYEQVHKVLKKQHEATGTEYFVVGVLMNDQGGFRGKRGLLVRSSCTCACVLMQLLLGLPGVLNP